MRARTRAGAALLLPLALLLLVGAGLPAAAQSGDTGWVIDRFDVTVLLNEDGSITVEERIDVDFGGLDKHGIYRVVPVRYEVPDDPSRFRVLELDGISVESSAPADLDVTRPARIGGDRDVVLRIGDPDRTVSGRHSYVLRYRVRGALNGFGEHDELYWNATGAGWPVPIRWARVQVGGAHILRHACYRGTVGATALCDDSGLLPGALPAWGTSTDLSPGEGMTVVVAMPKGEVAVLEPLFEERWTLARAFTGSPVALPLAGLIAVALAVGLGRLLWRAGRDRAALGGATSAGVVADAPRRGFGSLTVVPEFRPPDDLRPAQLGLLLDEHVDPADVSATIVDLAVRGHLRIEESVERKILWFSSTDWILRRRPEPEDDTLAGYERRLLDALFEDGDEVALSDLKGSFATSYKLVCGDVEDDAVARHWFGRRPSDTRTRWLVLGVVAVILSIAALVGAVLLTTFALAAVPLVLGALVLAVAHRWMPARTSEGSRLLARAVGFREYVRKAEVGRMEFAEAQRMFVAYLPYAVAFGAVDHWAETFAGIGVTAATLDGWYVGSHIGTPGTGLHRMSAGLSDFSRAVGGSLPVTPASSGSSGFGGGGFSGGGFGGGGGGSW